MKLIPKIKPTKSCIKTKNRSKTANSKALNLEKNNTDMDIDIYLLLDKLDEINTKILTEPSRYLNLFITKK